MKKTILLLTLIFCSSKLYAAEDSYTLIQILMNAIKTLETAEKAYNLQKDASVALAGSLWRDIGGSTNWRNEDNSMGINFVGNMTNISFNQGNEMATLGINIDEAIRALQGKGELNFSYANQVIKLQTESIRRDGDTMNRLLSASKGTGNQLQALQVLLRMTLESINQTRNVRTQLASDSQYQVNKDKLTEEKERVRKEKQKEIMRWKY